MHKKAWAALLLGVACLSIVLVLAKNNLNQSSALIPEAIAPEYQGGMTWEKVLSSEMQQTAIPESILKQSGGNLIIPHSDTMALRHSVKFCMENNFLPIASFLQKELAGKSGVKEDWDQAGQYIYTYAVQMQDTARRDFLMAEAIHCFNKVLESEPENKQALLFKGMALADRMESIMQAVPILKQVLSMDPDNILANHTLGILDIESGQLDKALVKFEKLISLQPSNAEYQYQAGRVQLLLGNKAEALKYYEKSKELTEDPEIQQQLDLIIQQLK